MTPEESHDYLKSLEDELNAAFCTACEIWFNKGLVPLDGIESGSIPLRIELPEEWKTSPPSEEVQDRILASLEFAEFWSDVLEQIEVCSQGGNPRGKIVPGQAEWWLEAHGYRHLIDRLKEFWFDCLRQSVANRNQDRSDSDQ